MLEIRDVAKQITSKLTQNLLWLTNHNQIWFQTHLYWDFCKVGVQKNIFQQHLDILVSLKAFKDCEIINQQRLYKLYSDSLKETKNLLIFYKEVQNEILKIGKQLECNI